MGTSLDSVESGQTPVVGRIEEKLRSAEVIGRPNPVCTCGLPVTAAFRILSARDGAFCWYEPGRVSPITITRPYVPRSLEAFADRARSVLCSRKNTDKLGRELFIVGPLLPAVGSVAATRGGEITMSHFAYSGLLLPE